MSSTTHQSIIDPHGGEAEHDEHGESGRGSSVKLPSFLQFDNLPRPIQYFLTEIDITTEEIFHCKKRGTTHLREISLGFVQFISCLYVLPVVPDQLSRAGYERTSSIVSTCTTCALGCITGSVLTNLPFIIAPPTSVSIFLAVYLQQQNLAAHEGNVALITAGIGLMIIGFVRPLGTFITRVCSEEPVIVVCINRLVFSLFPIASKPQRLWVSDSLLLLPDAPRSVWLFAASTQSWTWVS